MNLLSIGAAYGVRRRRLPVGLGRRPARHRRRTDQPVHPDDALRHRVRTVDGLRGLHALPHPRGVPDAPATPPPRSPTAWPRPPGSSPPPPRSWSSSSHLHARGRPRRSSCSASGSRSPCCSTPRSSAWCVVPATMELLGDRNWWIPKWLDRLLPKLNVDGRAHHTAPDDADAETSPRQPPIQSDLRLSPASRSFRPQRCRRARSTCGQFRLGRAGEDAVGAAWGRWFPSHLPCHAS